jgi:hypothetical protein
MGFRLGEWLKWELARLAEGHKTMEAAAADGIKNVVVGIVGTRWEGGEGGMRSEKFVLLV